MRLLKVLAVVALVCSAGSAFATAAPYSGGWDFTWDFSDGTSQGFTMSSTGAMTTFLGVNAMFLPDGASATYDATLLPTYLGLNANLNGRAGGSRFVLQADVSWGATVNKIRGEGVGAVRSSDQKGITISGTGNGVRSIDKGWDNTNMGKSWSVDTTPDGNGRAQQWFTLQIDYGFTTAGKFTTWQLNGINYGFPLNLLNDRDVHPGDNYNILRLGAQVGVDSPWSQFYITNVKLAIVPEPSSLIALGAGMVGMLGLIRRK